MLGVPWSSCESASDDALAFGPDPSLFWRGSALPGVTVKNTFYNFELVDVERPTAACERCSSAPPKLATHLGRQARPSRNNAAVPPREVARRPPNNPKPPRKRRAEGLRAKVLVIPSSLPSRGSKNHHMGQCKPCREMQKTGACPCGRMCNFCHFNHEEQRQQVLIWDHLPGMSPTMSTLASLQDGGQSTSSSSENAYHSQSP